MDTCSPNLANCGWGSRDTVRRHCLQRQSFTGAIVIVVFYFAHALYLKHFLRRPSTDILKTSPYVMAVPLLEALPC